MAAFSDRTQVKSARPVSEFVRERETFEYSSSLLSAIRLNETGKPTPSSELAAADDVILTGLAQLGVLQTGTDRSLISLFDAHRQYIVAEATPTQRLYPSLKSDDCDQPLWLCGTAIPRSHGVCELSLLADRALDAGHGTPPPTTNELPLTIAYDLAVDTRFSSRPFCQCGGLARFYAAVPIRTRRGINIGVYCVMNETPNKTWKDDFSQRLRDISCAIMNHLEAQRLKVLHRRDIRMNRGLGSFIEGKSTVFDWQQASSHAVILEDIQEHEGDPNQQLQRQQDEPGEEVETDVSPTTTRPSRNGVSRPRVEAGGGPGEVFPGQYRRRFSMDSPDISTSQFKSMAALTEEEMSALILSKAANIIRESIEVDSCLLFEAPIQPYLSPDQNTAPTDKRSQSSATSSSDENPDARRRSKALSQCRLLGYSTATASSFIGAPPSSQPRIALPENLLSKLLQRYPRGRIFNFGADGELQSDSSEDEQLFAPSDDLVTRPQPSSVYESGIASISLHDKPRSRSSAERREGKALLKAFPGARSVAFVPVWDPRKDRWYAGGFVYTKDVARSFSVEQELSYLKAFGMLVMSEILRFKDLRDDKAKADALGSLSHELRSPLHGILLNAELLIDTRLDIFQGNVAHTIETCSRTLLDTVDHLLEYSRISHLSGRDDKAPSVALDGYDAAQFGKKSLLRNSRLDLIVEDVVESVFAGFNFLHFSVKQLSDQQRGSMNSDVHANHHSDSLQAMDQLEPWMTKNGELRWSFGDVLIILSMDATCNWAYRVNVGAIRRIIMNIFGNALKHTKRGTITVSLTQDMARMRGRKKERVVKFTVQDTGKGIGADFLKYGLFRPFSQEDPLSPGAGLGLSLVKQITSHLHGDVSIQSELGHGTTASVTLPLEHVVSSSEAAPVVSDEDKVFQEQVEDLKGLRVRLIIVNSDWQKSVLDTCRDWLHMEIIPNTPDTTVTPDLVMWCHTELDKVREDIESFAKTPNVVICPNALVAYRQSHTFKAAGPPAVFEFISQPTGPRKLARTLHSAYMRWMDSSNTPAAAASVPMVMKRPKGPKRMPSAFSAAKLSRPTISRSTTTGSRSGSNASTAPNSKPGTPPKTIDDPLALQDEPQAPRIKFLLVDDNHINLKVLQIHLERRHRIGVQTAVNGAIAVDCFHANPSAYTCILMDISMPVMDGFEATRRIRAHEAQKGLTPVPIIALSGLTTEGAQQEAFGSGIDVFLTKPVQLATLDRLLESHGILKTS